MSGTFKSRHPKWFTNRPAVFRIEADAPDIEKTGPIRNKVKTPAVRRPAWFVVEVSTLGDPYPFTSCNRDDINARDPRLICFGGDKAHPFLVGRESPLI